MNLGGAHDRTRKTVLLATTVAVLLVSIHSAFGAPTGKPRVAKNDGTALPKRMPLSKGRDYFVDGQKGVDRGPGTLTRPWQTINYALGRVPLAGSRVLVRGGTYVGAVEFNRSGDPSNPVTLRAYPGEHVLLTAPPKSLLNAVWIYGASGIRIRGFEVTGPTSNNGFRIENSHDVEVAGCNIHNAGHMGLEVVGTGSGGNRNIQVWSNRFHDNGGAWISEDPYWIRGDHAIYWGATSSDTDGVDHTAYGGVVANNLIYDQAFGRGVQIGSQVSGLIVTNNTIYRSYQQDFRAGNGIQFWGQDNPYAPRDVLVVNNILADNAHHGVFGSGDNPLMQSNVVRNNLAWNNPDGDFRTTFSITSSPLFQLGPRNITGHDPLFVGASTLDLRLRPGSPAIGKADPAYAPATDFKGRLRSSAPDLGALEH